MDKEYINKICEELDLGDNFLEKINDNLYLRKKDMEILKRNDIDYEKYSSLSSIIYEIEEILNNEDNEELELLSKELSERNYYENTNK